MADMVAIRFTKNSLPYLTGEVAWFNELQAAAYIKQGFAERGRDAGKFVPAPRRSDMIAETGSTQVLVDAAALRDLVTAAAMGMRPQP